MARPIRTQIIMEGMTFDDLLLVPGYTDFKRQDVDLSVNLHPTIRLKIPVCSSPMDSVSEEAMCLALGKAGGLGMLHRNMSVSSQASMVIRIKAHDVLVGAAVGIGADFKERTRALAKANTDVIVIDSGHGYTKSVIDAIVFIKEHYPSRVIMAGNVATRDGAMALIRAGADILRVGMGPGSICTTRIVTGMGVPQITAIMEAVKAVKALKGNPPAGGVTVVADGGIRQIGDMAKALGVGASAVMLGSLLAGFDESPGEVITIDGVQYKRYRGMGSIGAMKKGSAERYGQSQETSIRKLVSEGVEGMVRYKGSVHDYLEQVAGSLRSSFYYVGVRTIDAFHKQARFIRITGAGLKESHPHSITISDAGSNYSL